MAHGAVGEPRGVIAAPTSSTPPAQQSVHHTGSDAAPGDVHARGAVGRPDATARVGARPVLATARLQLTPSFGFERAAEVVPMLAAAGVSHVYLSPVLRAAPGSRHGYDVIDPHHLDLERGGEAAFQRLVDTAHAHGLGVLLDVVPNHLAGDPHGPAWSDVLRHGRASRFASWFDLAWASGNDAMRDRILLPILGTDLDEAIAAGDVRLMRCGADVVLRVDGQQLPLSIESLAEITSGVAAAAADGVRSASCDRYLALAADLQACADRGDLAAGHRTGCRLGSLVCDDPAIAQELDGLLASMSSDAAVLTWILDRQHYELAHWRDGTRRLDRRRFFDVAELVGVRQEDPEVFAATHARVLGMVHSAAVDGLRIDHPDGLTDPTGYLGRLRAEIGDTWLVVEKILSEGEELPASWPVDGTVGYEHGALLDRLLVLPDGEAALTDVVSRHAPEADGVATDDLDAVIQQGKRDALRMLFQPELGRLTALAAEVCGLEEDVARVALTEMVVACPVYRTYVRRGAAPATADAEVLDHLAADATTLLRCDPTAVAAVAAVAAVRAVFDHTDRSDVAEVFVARFQQLTSAVTAKGVEDTACYRIPRLVSLCEVGADPRRWSVSVDEWHAARARELVHHPLGLVATSTHDSKRSLDARCRIAALSEMPDRWADTADAVIARLDALLGLDGRDQLFELLLLQLVAAVHPAGTDRLVPAAVKAAREAKHRTTWHDPDEAYEQTLERTVHALVTDPACRAALAPLLAELVPAGRCNSLAAHLLVFAGPGVPDLYQGSFGWRTTLADPDNRDDPDPAAEQRLLAEAAHRGPEVWRSSTRAGLAADDRGLAKAYLLKTCLQLRRRFPTAVGEGASYTPLDATGAGADHVVAHVAGDAAGDRFAVVATRAATTLDQGGGWRNTELVLPPGAWTDVLRADRRIHTGAVALADLVGELPGALLVRS